MDCTRSKAWGIDPSSSLRVNGTGYKRCERVRLTAACVNEYIIIAGVVHIYPPSGRAFEAEPRSSAVFLNKSCRTQLKVYRYELPWYIAFPYSRDDWEFGISELYKAFEAFYEQFGEDTVVR